MTKKFVVFKWSDSGIDEDRWYRHELEIDTPYGTLSAQELGERLGAGEYVYWETGLTYPSVTEIVVRAVTRFEEADEPSEVEA